MSIILPDQVLGEMVCSECWKYLSVLPVLAYPNRTVRCGRCIEEDDGGVPSQVFPTSLFKCVNRYEGCTSLLLPEQVKEHEKICTSKNLDDCPLCTESKMPPLVGSRELTKGVSQQFRVLQGSFCMNSKVQPCDTSLKKRFEFSLGEFKKSDDIFCELNLNFDVVQVVQLKVKDSNKEEQKQHTANGNANSILIALTCMNMFMHELDCTEREPIPICPVPNCAGENFKNFSELKSHFNTHKNTILKPYCESQIWFGSIKQNDYYMYLDHVTAVFCSINNNKIKLNNVIKSDKNEFKIFVNNTLIALNEKIEIMNCEEPLEFRVTVDYV
ncbi:unnamed protein product [Brassicogethes aeneus]|uniref:Uncharacterized protein n=1 Tax=Brassicogethes aeneus TaxID=1431903 RepID=A0A9P0AQ33_BRAAE|nr:unnamed protein product [Brassicogethes aeneus]